MAKQQHSPIFIINSNGGRTAGKLVQIPFRILFLEDLQLLIKQCAANNRRSQEKLYLKFYPALFALCKKFFRDDHEALEALNDGMMKIYKNITAYNSSKGSFFNWAYTVVRNTALDKIKLHKLPEAKELSELLQADSNPLKGLEWKDIYTLLDCLAPATRPVCSLFYLEGFSIKEISEKMGISQGTVKWHLNETRLKLKLAFKTYYS